MTRSETLVVESILVLGSKPEARLPDIPAERVYGVNGAVEIAAKYREKFGSRIIGFVRTFELRKFEHIQESIKRAKPDELVIIGDDVNIEDFVKEEMGLTNVKINRITSKEKFNIVKKVLGWRIFLVGLERIKVRGIKHFIRKVIPDVILGKTKEWMNHSTGLDAIMFIMTENPKLQIITTGICPVAGGHFNKIGKFTEKTAQSDRGTMLHWPTFKRPQVYTTDDVFHESWDVPMLKGGTFTYND